MLHLNSHATSSICWNYRNINFLLVVFLCTMYFDDREKIFAIQVQVKPMNLLITKNALMN